MSYKHSVEKAQEFANAALERIKLEGLLPTPENYELWFIYFSGADPVIKKAVDKTIEECKGSLTDQDCYDIFQEYLSTHREERTVRAAGDQIKKTIETVNHTITSAQDRANNYTETLSDAHKTLSNVDDLSVAKEVVSNVLTDTSDMIEQNKQLEEMLEFSTRAIEDMRKDLEIARREALTDALTGLSNRKAFDQEIQRLVELSEDEETHTFSLVLMDIDKFKEFNDTFGHQVGDQVLKLVARTIKDGTKGRDMSARYGGEEFALLLPETNLQGGLKLGELLRQEVEKKELINRATGKKLAKITFSAGVAQYFKGESIDEMIERADAALYKAKREGRNRVLSA